MAKLRDQLNKRSREIVNEDGRWLMGVPAIVAENDDPERQHRVKVVIPSIDEVQVYDEWARQLVFCLGDGFGTVFIPPIGSEVVLFGQLGEKYNLFYASLYNEEMAISSQLGKTKPGIHSPADLVLIAEMTAKILAENIEINAEQLVKVLGNNVKSEASQMNEVKGSTVTINGATVSIAGDGSISISGGNVSISGSAVTIEGRAVRKVGPPI